MHKSCIIVTHGLSGYFACLLTWSEDCHGGFWEPHSTGAGRYKTRPEAEVEAKQWALDEGLEYKE